ncbi:hypothetical protein [Microvirus D_HF4_144]|nr:hypothetical protein [Microvirus D_HF4_144]WMC01520.1 hypothetical protein [Microvirus D_HF5_131]
MNKNKSRYSWFCDVEPDDLSEFEAVPDFSDNLKILEVTNPIDPKTGFPISDLGLYFNSQVSDDVKELIAKNLQRLGVVNSTQGLTDEQLISVLPSRYTQRLGEVSQWRDQLERFVKSDYDSVLHQMNTEIDSVTTVPPSDTTAPQS